MIRKSELPGAIFTGSSNWSTECLHISTPHQIVFSHSWLHRFYFVSATIDKVRTVTRDHSDRFLILRGKPALHRHIFRDQAKRHRTHDEPERTSRVVHHKRFDLRDGPQL